MEPDDHSLMLSVRDGNTERLGTLFERHHRALYNFFLRLTAKQPCSEDLVQQVFYRILKYRHTYRNEGSFKTWMYHLARKVLADHFRKSARHPSLLPEQAVLEALPDDTPHPAQLAEHNDNLSLMKLALTKLTEEQREVLTLQRFQHLPHEELARIYECSVPAIKVRVHRALQALRQGFFRLKNQNHEDCV